MDDDREDSVAAGAEEARRATVWRCIKRLAEEGGRTSALASRKRGRPTGTTLISGKVEAVLEEHFRRYFLRRERPSLSRIVTEMTFDGDMSRFGALFGMFVQQGMNFAIVEP